MCIFTITAATASILLVHHLQHVAKCCGMLQALLKRVQLGMQMRILCITGITVRCCHLQAQKVLQSLTCAAAGSATTQKAINYHALQVPILPPTCVAPMQIHPFHCYETLPALNNLY